MKALVLRLEAPLMSFGRVMVDNMGFSDDLPCLSFLTGLLGNALGYDRRHGSDLDQLQARVTYAARLDMPGERLVDYQTADLSLPFMTSAWTTHGRVVVRAGGPSSKGTHIRYRHFLANAAVTVVLAVSNGAPTLEEIGSALKRPARPLFIGRKPCLPSRPIWDGEMVEAESLRAALDATTPLSSTHYSPPPARPPVLLARWPAREGTEGEAGRLIELHESRDWVNQVHVGRTSMYEGYLSGGAS